MNESEGFPEEIGGYQIIRKLERQGGMSIVFEALHSGTNRKVVLKVLDIGRKRLSDLFDSAEPEGRFHREIDVAKRLNHINIARVYDGDASDDLPWYAMEYINGPPLNEYLEVANFSIKERIRFFIKICQAIDYANGKGVIHRDIKPSNILVDEQNEPKVLDFGLAKAIAESTDSDETFLDLTLRSVEGQTLGTPPYMSPEQANGDNENISFRTDVYGLGIVLFEILVGKLPHPPGMDNYKLLQHIGNNEISIPLTDIRRDRIPKDVRAILRKATAFKQKDRYSIAGDLAQDLENFLKNDRVSARNVSPFYPIKKLIAKHKGVSIASCMVIISFIGLFVAWSIENRKRAETESNLRQIAEAEKKLAEIERSNAQADREKANRAASQSSFLLSRRFATENDAPNMLAHLASAVRRNPQNRSARAAAVNSLIRAETLPEKFRFRIKGPVKSCQFSKNSKQLLVVGEKMAQLRSVDDAKLVNSIRVEGRFVQGILLHSGEDEQSPVAVVIERFRNEAKSAWYFKIHSFGGNWENKPILIQGGYRTMVFDPTSPRFFVQYQSSNQKMYFSGWTVDSERKLIPYLNESKLNSFAPNNIAGGIFLQRDLNRIYYTRPADRKGHVYYFDIDLKSVEKSKCKIGVGSIIMTSLKQSRSGKYFVGAGTWGQVSVWKPLTDELVSHFTYGRELGHTVRGPSISGNDQWVAAGVRGGEVVIWDLNSKTPYATLPHNTDPVFTTFDKQDRRLLSRTIDGYVYLWDLKSKSKLVTPFKHGRTPITLSKFDPSGRSLVTISKPEEGQLSQVRVWGATPRKLTPQIFDCKYPLDSIDMSRRGNYLIAGSKTAKQVYFCDLNESEPKVIELPHSPTTQYWSAPTIDPAGTKFATQIGDQQIAIYDTNNPKHPSFQFNHRHRVSACLFSNGGDLLAVGDEKNQVSLYQLFDNDYEEISRFSMRRSIGFKIDDELDTTLRITRLTFSPDNTILAAANFNFSNIAWWKTHQNNPKPLHIFDVPDYTTSLKISPDNRILATGNVHNNVRVVNISQPYTYSTQHHRAKVNALEFIPGQNRFLSASADKTLRFWRYSITADILEQDAAPINLDDSVVDLDVSPDGFLGASASGNQVHLWDLVNSEEITAPLVHSASVSKVLFHPEKSLLIVGCVDGKISIWPIANGVGTPEEWFIDFVETVGGLKLTDDNQLVPIATEEEDKIRTDTIHRIANVKTNHRNDYENAVLYYLSSNGYAGEFHPPAVDQDYRKLHQPAKQLDDLMKWLSRHQLRHPEWLMMIRDSKSCHVTRFSGHTQNWKIDKIDAPARSIHFSEPWRIVEFSEDYQTYRMIYKYQHPDNQWYPVESYQPLQFSDSKISDAPTNLRTFGKLNGKRFRVPESLSHEEIVWVTPVKKGAYVGTKNTGVFFIDETGARLILETPCKQAVLMEKWAGTVLTFEDELKPIYLSKVLPPIKNVAKFIAAGQENKTGFHSLLALHTDGRLSLNPIDAEMRWDFDHWAKDRRFRDCCMRTWQGIHAPVLAVEKNGNLHAFNRMGFFKLPEHLRTNVRSVATGGSGIRLSIIKENGDIYQIVRPLDREFPLENYLAIWSKTPREFFGNKKPVKLHREYTWKTVQFDDGTWEVWNGLTSFRTRSFIDAAPKTPMWDLQMMQSKSNLNTFLIGIR